MANPRLRLLLRAAGPPPPPADQVSDGELLRRFVAARDPAAFESLVWRHGPMVRAVCRQVLRDPHDTDDAFQATFLVLVRRAEAVRAHAAVGGWLYRVAYRVARKLRDQLARRVPTSETLAMTPGPDQPLPSADLAAAIDEEIAKLPDKYRLPVQLCYVAGVGTTEAARRLGIAKGTLLTRLAWARKRLRANLSNRGITLTVGSLATALGTRTVAALSPELVRDTVQSAVAVLAGTGLAAAVASERTLSLSEGVVQAMFWHKVKIVAGLMVLTAAVAGVGLGRWTAPAQAQTKSDPTRSPATAKAKTTPPPSHTDPVLEPLPSPMPLSPVTPPAVKFPEPISNFVPPLPAKARKTFQFDSPAGHWQRSTAGDKRKAQINIHIDDERVAFTIVATYGGDPVTTTIQADYSVNKESLLYGVVTSADTQLPEGANAPPLGVTWPEEDQLFSFRFRVDGDTLTVKDVRFPGLSKEAAEDMANTFGGRYGIAPPTSSPQIPTAPTRPMRSLPKKPKQPATETPPLPYSIPSVDPVTPTLPPLPTAPGGNIPSPTPIPSSPPPSSPPAGPGGPPTPGTIPPSGSPGL